MAVLGAIAFLVLCVLSILMARATSADAMISSNTTTTFASQYPGHTIRTDNTPGGHGDYHIKIDFKLDPDDGYDPTVFNPSPTQRPKQIAGDFPAGFITNPAAIPYEDRCPQEVFENQSVTKAVPSGQGYDEVSVSPEKCPESSRIGSSMSATSTEILGPHIGAAPYDFTSDNPAHGWFDAGEDPTQLGTTYNIAGMEAPLYLLQTDNDAPAEVGTIIRPAQSITSAVHVKTQVKPIMSGPDKGRLRWVSDSIPRRILLQTGAQQYGDIRVDKFEMTLWGRLPRVGEEDPNLCVEANPGFPAGTEPAVGFDYGWNPYLMGIGASYLDSDCRTGKAFITNPTSPGPWTSHFYANEYDDNSNANYDVTGSGVNQFLKLADLVTTPEPSVAPALNTTAEASFADSRRFENTALDVNISNPGYATTDGDQRGADVPKKISTVLPDAVNVDIDEVGRLCEPADFDDRDCPENSKVGSVTIKTPLLRQGMRGDAVLVRQTPGGPGNLPRLGLILYGDAPFNILSSTRYTGNGTQIETTFDDIPQIGFESMRLHIDGGSHGLLKVDRCQAGGADLGDGGPTKFTITGYTGQTKTVESQPYTPTNCFSSKVTPKKISKCVKSNGALSVSPTYASRSAVKSAKLTVGKRSATSKKSPFNPKLKLKGLKKGKSYKYKLAVSFKPQGGKTPKSVTKTGSFKTCR